jgi:hypothetical protein
VTIKRYRVDLWHVRTDGWVSGAEYKTLEEARHYLTYTLAANKFQEASSWIVYSKVRLLEIGEDVIELEQHILKGNCS